MNRLDPTTLKDWQLAQAAEERMKPIGQLAREMGLEHSEILPIGPKMAKVDFRKVLARVKDRPNAKYIDICGITPTPLGEGKTTTTVGLIQGLAKLGLRATGAVRQASSGPTFNIKGTSAGGGLSQILPVGPLSIRFTGDIDCVTNAHNLAMVALTARMQHERNYSDEQLARRGLRRLDIDPNSVQIKWAIDFCAQALRRIRIGLGGPKDGVEMESGFQISVSSEVMAILAIAQDLADLRTRIGRMVVAHDKAGRPITTADLEVDGAMAAWLVDAINPNLVQTTEGQPIFVHAGPFANIAIGQSSIVADKLGVKLADYHVTESGFGADIGYEKFWNIKCRLSGLTPDAVVIVATVRALKMHGGGPAVRPGLPLPQEYTTENLGLLEKGCENLLAHIEIVKSSGIARPVVCINRFPSDSLEELRLVKRIAEQAGAYAAISEHWQKGGEGAIELAEAVVDAANQDNDFRFLYDLHTPLLQRIELIARQVYGADGVTIDPLAQAKIKALDSDKGNGILGTCMVKTHLSLSHDPNLKGRPKGWVLPIRDVLIYRGAGLAVPVAGDINLMPGTGSDPAFRRINVDVQTGRIVGL
ncbi:MAG: formate--tetrahydrofolate ligase [Sedimentisphaerales bacterium]|nr:formate--tetrahydrofolate ligase [Sedimentisphaerales bacterium]